jgi:hypothetical protein
MALELAVNRENIQASIDPTPDPGSILWFPAQVLDQVSLNLMRLDGRRISDKGADEHVQFLDV